MSAARGCVLFEFFEIDVEIVERAITNGRRVRAQRLDVIEFRHPVSAPFDEIALQFFERSLQLDVG